MGGGSGEQCGLTERFLPLQAWVLLRSFNNLLGNLAILNLVGVIGLGTVLSVYHLSPNGRWDMLQPSLPQNGKCSQDNEWMDGCKMPLCTVSIWLILPTMHLCGS